MDRPRERFSPPPQNVDDSALRNYSELKLSQLLPTTDLGQFIEHSELLAKLKPALYSITAQTSPSPSKASNNSTITASTSMHIETKDEFALCSTFNASTIGDSVCVPTLSSPPHACYFLEPTQAAVAIADGSCAGPPSGSAQCDGGRHFCRVDFVAGLAVGGGRSRAPPRLRERAVRPDAFMVLNLPSSSVRLDRMRSRFKALRLPPL